MLNAAVTPLDPDIFRAYDIRGIVGQSLTTDTLYLLGLAIGSLALEAQIPELVCARDGRLSSPVLFKALCEGILATGCHVIDIGMVPTPVLYYGVHHLTDTHSGLMLTGSHNPANYNGIKLVMQGKSPHASVIQTLYERILQQRFCRGQGSLRAHDVAASYLAEAVNRIQLTRPLQIVIDAGNGVSGVLAPQLFRALGCTVHELHCDIDGRFPHHHPDPSQPENLIDLIHMVQEVKADIGLAFDGDGDRLGVVTDQGEVIWPDRLLMLFSQALLATCPQAKIIFDVKCTDQLSQFITAHAGQPIMWKTGHSLIKTKLAETNAHLAGEMSGHFFFPHEWYAFDDALYAGMRLLQILAQHANSSSAVFAALPNSVNTPELKIFVTEQEKFQLMKQLTASANFVDALNILTIDGLRVNFAEGWGLLRPSNTTPCLVARFEAANETTLQSIQILFRDWITTTCPHLVVPF